MTHDTTRESSQDFKADSSLPDKEEYAPSEALGTLAPISSASSIEEKNWPSGWKPFATLFGGFLLMFNSWGIVNAYGTFSSFYTETLFQEKDALLTNLIGSTQSAVVLLFSFVVGRLLDAGYSRHLILTGAVVITAGMFGLSGVNGAGGVNQGNYFLTWFTQGLVTGLGMACFFVTR